MRKYMTKKKKAENAQRKRARYHLEKKGRVKKFDWKEVDHKKGMKGGNGKKNLRVVSRKKNRRLWAKKAIAARKRRKRNGGKY